jgi:hypothetical protein
MKKRAQRKPQSATQCNCSELTVPHRIEPSRQKDIALPEEQDYSQVTEADAEESQFEAKRPCPDTAAANDMDYKREMHCSSDGPETTNAATITSSDVSPASSTLSGEKKCAHLVFFRSRNFGELPCSPSRLYDRVLVDAECTHDGSVKVCHIIRCLDAIHRVL